MYYFKRERFFKSFFLFTQDNKPLVRYDEVPLYS
jgi:hypothetical protein